MGAESRCELRFDGASHRGKALLEYSIAEVAHRQARREAGARGLGAIWVIHPKAPNALRDTEIFAEAKRVGLTYTKVARFSATHTAEKLVIPKAKR
jgi:hypothetical protein